MPDTRLPDVMQVAIRRALSEVHTCIPGRIQSYNHEKQKAQVKPLIKKRYKDGQVSSLPVVVNVPVIWPRSSNASLTFPVKKGDYVLLLFAERSIERFLSQGGEQEPGDFRKFDLTDGIAIPGLMPFSENSRSDNNEDVLLIYNDTSVRIKEGGNFEITASDNQVINITNNSSLTVGGAWDIEVNGNVNLTAPSVNIDGNVNVSGTITASGDVVGSGVSLSGHTHGGVESGGDSTGPPS